MWILNGPFDTEKPTSNDPAAIISAFSTSKPKLLKTGREYVFGRRKAQLNIDHGKVSMRHASFIIAPLSENDVNDPSAIPQLSLKNVREKTNQTMVVERGDITHIIKIGQVFPLEASDVVIPVGGIRITVTWRRICCFTPPTQGRPSASLASLASLGVSLASSPSPHATHFLTSKYAFDGPSATALLQSYIFVKPDWLSELVRLGELDSATDPASLENYCDLPRETKYRPAWSSTLPGTVKSFDVWAPNEMRMRMFKNLVFLCVGEKGREVANDVRTAIEAGDGKCELFNCGDGRFKFGTVVRKMQKKLKGEHKIVLVASEQDVKRVIGQEDWKEFVDEAAEARVTFIGPSAISQAVASVDTSLLFKPSDAASGSSDSQAASSLPDFVPNTHPDEPSNPPESEEQSGSLEAGAGAGTRSRLPRRRAATPSGSSSRPLSPPRQMSMPPDEETAATPAPRKALVRRARKPQIIGIDDPSMMDDETSQTSQVAPAPAVESAPVPPTPARSSRLKRRAGTTQTQRHTVEDIIDVDTGEEPPLKKFKQLFDESDPDRLAQSQLASGSGDVYDSEAIQSLGFTMPQNYGSLSLGGGAMGTSSETQAETQPETQPGRGTKSQMPPPRMPALREEEEESQTQATRFSKRTTTTQEDTPAADEPTPEHAAASGKTSQKRGGTVPPTPSSSDPKDKAEKHGAEPGQPDTDAAFLKALASRKTGRGGKPRKGEDDFDREFNNLKISKPEIERDREATEADWGVLEEFGDERDVRGNFMVVLEMEVPEHRAEREGGRRRRGENRPEWEGKQDFKKFRRKAFGERRAPVTLVLAEQGDAGMGAAYWPQVTYTQLRSEVDDSALLQSSSPPHGEQGKKAAPKAKPQPRTTQKKRAYSEVESDKSDEEDIVIVAKSRKTSRRPASRAGSAVPQTQRTQPGRTARATRGTGKSQQPLFIDSDSDGDGKDGDFNMELEEVTEDFDAEIAAVPDVGDDYEDEDEDVAPQGRSGKSQTQTARKASVPPVAATRGGAKRKVPVVRDDDSDDGMTFKGFGGKKRR